MLGCQEPKGPKRTQLNTNERRSWNKFIQCEVEDGLIRSGWDLFSKFMQYVVEDGLILA